MRSGLDRERAARGTGQRRRGTRRAGRRDHAGVAVTDRCGEREAEPHLDVATRLALVAEDGHVVLTVSHRHLCVAVDLHHAFEERDRHEHAAVRVRRRGPSDTSVDEELDCRQRVEAAHVRGVARPRRGASERRACRDGRRGRVARIAELHLRVGVLIQHKTGHPEKDAHKEYVLWAASGVFPALHLFCLAKP